MPDALPSLYGILSLAGDDVEGEEFDFSNEPEDEDFPD